MSMAALVKQTYPPICWLCHLPIDDSDYSIDHVVPRSKGGDVWDIDNMRPAHLKCNMRRGNRDARTIVRVPKPSRRW